MQASQNTGVAGSSSQFGSVGALGTLTGANVANMQSSAAAARGIGVQNQRIASAQSEGQLWGTIGGISGSVFGAAGGFGSLGFGSNSPTNGGTPTNFQSEVFTF